MLTKVDPKEGKERVIRPKRERKEKARKAKGVSPRPALRARIRLPLSPIPKVVKAMVPDLENGAKRRHPTVLLQSFVGGSRPT